MVDSNPQNCANISTFSYSRKSSAKSIKSEGMSFQNISNF